MPPKVTNQLLCILFSEREYLPRRHTTGISRIAQRRLDNIDQSDFCPERTRKLSTNINCPYCDRLTINCDQYLMESHWKSWPVSVTGSLKMARNHRESYKLD